MMIMMVIGPCGVQLSLKSYEWSTKSNKPDLETDLLITNMITGQLDDTESFYQLITTITISKKYIFIYRRACNSNLQTFNNNSHWAKHSEKLDKTAFYNVISLAWLGMVGHCYSCCDQFFDWWIYLSILNVIGWHNCPIKGFRSHLTVRWHCSITTLQNY